MDISAADVPNFSSVLLHLGSQAAPGRFKVADRFVAAFKEILVGLGVLRAERCPLTCVTKCKATALLVIYVIGLGTAKFPTNCGGFQFGFEIGNGDSLQIHFHLLGLREAGACRRA